MKQGTRMLALLLAVLLSLPLVPYAGASGGVQDLPEIRSYADADFTDVAEDWSKPGIVAAYELGLMNGKGNHLFDPDGYVTLAEVVSVSAQLYNLWHGNIEPIPAGKDTWYGGALDLCIDHGIVKKDEFLDYTKVATRAQVAGILARSAPIGCLVEKNTVTALPDVVDATPYSPEILSLYRAGVINGTKADGTFNPYGQITRKELAAILFKMAKPSQRGDFSFSYTKAPAADQTVYSSNKILYMNEAAVVGLLEIGGELYFPLKVLQRWDNAGMSKLTGIDATTFYDKISLTAVCYGEQEIHVVDVQPLPDLRRNLGTAGSYTGLPVFLEYQEASSRSVRTQEITDQVRTLGGEYPMVPLSVLGIDLTAKELEWNVCSQSRPRFPTLEKDLAGDALKPLVSSDITATIQAIHDCVVSRLTYDPRWVSGFYNGDTNDAMRAATAAEEKAMADGYTLGNNLSLACGYGVCEDYAALFQEMCLRAGIPCQTVVGYIASGDHAWNKVWNGSAWVHVDCTLDDPLGTPQLLQDYCMKDAGTMAITHYWQETDYPLPQEYDPAWEQIDPNSVSTADEFRKCVVAQLKLGKTDVSIRVTNGNAFGGFQCVHAAISYGVPIWAWEWNYTNGAYVLHVEV